RSVIVSPRSHPEGVGLGGIALDVGGGALALVGIVLGEVIAGGAPVVGDVEDAAALGGEWTPLTDDDMRRLGGRPMPTRPGDAVFFDSYTPHASGPNLTAERRRVLYITYNRRSSGDHRVRYYADKRKSFPPDIERDPTRTYTFRV
ncbi:MAG TPA: phytanoyl-CoA dioxygenase family protein, partial [Candidatus Dormibacteraeota bacterium]|nr:phytanoyl-CoA dioxygenase family protein [Candidatus Dormibacteraeota bacterium]